MAGEVTRAAADPTPGRAGRRPFLEATLRHRLLDATLVLLEGDGPVTVLFGPSGAGKTTLLRCLAGLDRPADGRVLVEGELWDGADGRGRRVHLPTRRRRVGYLFQENALFPHVDVRTNVGYGLPGRTRAQRAARDVRVGEVLRSTQADHVADRPVRTLSGGEAQRVALARALAPGPRLLLLDEPLSALDTPVRIELRTELRRVLVEQGVPTLVVTHDRTEALALGDQAAVIVAGVVRQTGPVDAVFDRPADAVVAAAVGVETALAGRVRSVDRGLVEVEVSGGRLTAVEDPALTGWVEPGSAVLVCIRAEDVALELPGSGRPTSPRNHVPGTVTGLVPHGPLVRVDLDCGFHLAAYVTRPAVEDLALAAGVRIVAAVKSPAVHVVARG